jgi:microcystin-dependent protein
MAEPFLGEVKIVSFNYPPRGWAFCNGQLLPINQNQALFSLLGTQYGGNGQTTFGLPDLRTAAAIHMGAGFTIGQRGGEAAHTLNSSEMPQHTHTLGATPNAGTTAVPTGNVYGKGLQNTYSSATSLVAMSTGTVSSVGGSQPHENRPPFLALNFVIALQGIFPSQN